MNLICIGVNNKRLVLVLDGSVASEIDNSAEPPTDRAE